MVTTDDRPRRVLESAAKFRAPAVLDESLCLYSPQDNVDSLDHPRIKDWFDFVAHRYEPPALNAPRRVLLLLPCTATKPYVLSAEHRRINAALLAAGFRADAAPDAALLPHRTTDEPEDLFSLGTLAHPSGVAIHRAVISEPLGLVPYEHLLTYPGGQSPAVAYDDPGLFEDRGNAVSPWRPDHTATRVGPGQWKWGPSEKRAYVAMHDAMARAVAGALGRFGARYTHRISWVAPGLTHRSFVVARDERAAHGIAATRKVGAERLPLTGANDLLPAELRITALPTRAQCDDALTRLATRLGTTPRAAAGHYGRGGGGATPLALPELLDDLLAAILPTPLAKVA